VAHIGLHHTSRNALVEVFIHQGDLMPVLLPQKWKVWWVTTCSIFFLWLIVANGTVFIYYAKWGSATWNKSFGMVQAWDDQKLVNETFLWRCAQIPAIFENLIPRPEEKKDIHRHTHF